MLKKNNKGKSIAKIIFILMLNIVLLVLGIWQIQRGLYKQHLLDIQLHTQELNLKLATKQPISNILYKTIQLNGKYTNPTFFLYRQHENKTGYWVINPFIDNDSQKHILLAHTFIPTTQNKIFLTLPELQKLYNPVDFTKNFKLNTYIIENLPRVFNLQTDNFKNINNSFINANIFLVQNLTFQQYNFNFTPKVENFTLVVANKNLPNLKQNANTNGMTPNKHYGYATTWLGLFIVSLYFSYLIIIKSSRNSN